MNLVLKTYNDGNRDKLHSTCSRRSAARLLKLRAKAHNTITRNIKQQQNNKHTTPEAKGMMMMAAPADSLAQPVGTLSSDP